MNAAQYVELWVGGLLTLMIFSFLYKDNPFYKFAEHLFVGVSAAYWMVVAFWSTLIPNMVGRIYPPSMGWFTVNPDEASALVTQAPDYWRIVPMILGFMMLTRLVPKWAWMSRWPMAFIIGFAAGTNLPRFLQSDFIAQIRSTVIPLIVMENGSFSLGGTFSNIIIVGGVLSALVYFFFSKEHKGWFGHTARGGIWVLMIAFGAAFGYTVMARISLLIGRMEFLGQWIGSVF
ncbi:MAG: hypothetical protein P9M15_04515 [Candidatus Electryoneaceae bacterium]|nr:hypothetical protein [Candidatus Electryoneaceae bacterium]